MGRVQGKVAVITGGSSGMGRATGTLMAREGAKVALFDIQDELGRQVAESIAAEGGVARYYPVDVRDEPGVRAAMADVRERFGSIDILMNNAAGGGGKTSGRPTHEIEEADWDGVFAVDVKGVFFCTKHAVPHMIEAGGGSIINISSVWGIVGSADSPPYHAAKAAVRMMAKTDAMLYGPQNIRVNSIHPGFIDTPMSRGGIAKSPDPKARLQAFIDQTALGRIGEADDIAYATLYLASDESSFVTGTELIVDGGMTAH